MQILCQAFQLRIANFSPRSQHLSLTSRQQPLLRRRKVAGTYYCFGPGTTEGIEVSREEAASDPNVEAKLSR